MTWDTRRPWHGLGRLAEVEEEVVGDAGAALDLELADVDLGVGDQGVVDLDQDALVVLGLGAAGGDVGGLDERGRGDLALADDGDVVDGHHDQLAVVVELAVGGGDVDDAAGGGVERGHDLVVHVHGDAGVLAALGLLDEQGALAVLELDRGGDDDALDRDDLVDGETGPSGPRRWCRRRRRWWWCRSCRRWWCRSGRRSGPVGGRGPGGRLLGGGTGGGFGRGAGGGAGVAGAGGLGGSGRLGARGEGQRDGEGDQSTVLHKGARALAPRWRG
jgi:hypothetical protein